MSSEQTLTRYIVKRVVLSIAAIMALIALIGAWVIVPAGHAGVIHRLGAVQMDHRQEGFHLKAPFLDSVEKIDVRLRAAQIQSSAASKDLQIVSTQVTVQYSLNAPLVPLTYQQIGNRGIVEFTVINPAIQESVKAVTAQYTAEELITRRAEVAAAIHQAIEKFIFDTLQEKGVGGAMSIANVAITDFDFSPEFNKAIEEKVKAEQDALRAENEKIRLITQAEAQARKVELEADAAAFQIEAESVARADAIRREAEALRNNPQLIQLRIAERWNGELPRVNGSSVVPLLNISDLLKPSASRSSGSGLNPDSSPAQ